MPGGIGQEPKIGAKRKRGPKPGSPRVGGRQKGTPNKVTGALKDMILTALDRAGGVDYLVTQSDENPTAFMTLIGKVLPMQVGGDPNNPLIHEIRRSFIDASS